MFRSLGNVSLGFWRYTIMSSANRLIRCSVFDTITPCNSDVCLMYWASGSINRAKRVGLRQQPCRVPRKSSKLFEDRLPFIFILAIGLLYKACMHAMKLVLNPNFLITINRYSQQTLSKAFSASRLTKAVGRLRFLTS